MVSFDTSRFGLPADTRFLEEGYGPSSLQLEIIKTHIANVLAGERISRPLAGQKSSRIAAAPANC